MALQAPPIHSLDAVPPGRFVRLGKSAPFKLGPTSLKFGQRQSEPARDNARRHIPPIRDARRPAHEGCSVLCCSIASRSRARASGPEAEPSLLRVKALRKVSTWQPCWSGSEAATAASRAFTSTAVPYLRVFRKISARSPFSNLPTPAV